MNKFRLSILQAAVILCLFLPAYTSFSEQDKARPKNGSGVIESPGVTRGISAADAALLIEENKKNPDFVILDVRTPGEYSEGHIENALNVDVMSESFTEKAGEMDKGITYLIHCRSGKRSAKAAALMEQLGFADIYDIEGGILAWEKEGLPIIK